jgi:hypothetical protein
VRIYALLACAFALGLGIGTFFVHCPPTQTITRTAP